MSNELCLGMSDVAVCFCVGWLFDFACFVWRCSGLYIEAGEEVEVCVSEVGCGIAAGLTGCVVSCTIREIQRSLCRIGEQPALHEKYPVLEVMRT